MAVRKVILNEPLNNKFNLKTNEKEERAEENSIHDESSISITNNVPESRFECPICLTWLRDPILTSCGHRFCRDCMESWLKREHPCCPIDNLPIHKDTDIFPDNFTRREISQQKTHCPNVKHGCLATLSPLDVEHHLAAVCEFRETPALLPDNEKLRCKFVNVGCAGKFEDELELELHLASEIQQHLNLISQAYSNLLSIRNNESSSLAHEASNFWDPPPKNCGTVTDQSSLIINSDNSNDLMKCLYEKIVILEQKNMEKDIIIANMTQQISVLNETLLTDTFDSANAHSRRLCNGTYFWCFNDFSEKIEVMLKNPKIHHYSPGFYTSFNGYKICARLNLSPRDPHYLAILIHIMRTDHDCFLEWPFSGRLTITITHPSFPEKHFKETMMTRPDLEAFQRPLHNLELNAKGFGYTEFALIEDLISGHYIDNDKLLIKIQAQVV